MKGLSFFLKLFLISLQFALDSVANPYCHNRFASLTPFEYPNTLSHLQPGVQHTIENLDQFLKEKLGSEVVHSIQAKSARYLVISGPAHSPLSYLKPGSIQSYREVSNPFGAFNSLEVTLKDGSLYYLFTNVNGRSRETQVLSLLKLAGAKPEAITLLGNSVSYRELYRRTFSKIGHQPDLVIFGFANTATEGLLLQSKLGSSSKLLATSKSYSTKKWIKPHFDEHELQKLGVQVLEFQSGKRVWLVDNEYGDRAAWLMQALHDAGCKKTVFFGTAGSLNPNYKIGEIVVPKFFVNESGQKIASPLKGRTFFRGSHGDVDSPSLETKEWLRDQLRAGVDYVDVELQKVLPALRKDSDFSAYFVISDEINSPKTRDYTHWSETERQGVRNKITDILRGHLEEVGIGATDQPVGLKIHLFETQGGPP